MLLLNNTIVIIKYHQHGYKTAPLWLLNNTYVIIK